ncbi:tRNA adenosine(34) deaminase TadA [Georgenia deserti]|uniref:tRNA-specific adenosine deaminase n=1 Tax=Georgenia deserti TaxID=2093781 RepID=A0ABW4LC90_9MICO
MTGSARAPAPDPAVEGAMDEALDLARRAAAGGDVPVGAVVLGPDGAVLGRGRNRREADGDPTAHAEILALREASRALAGWRLDGCTLVVTLEPCTMCAGALVLARIGRIVLGAWDPKAGAAGSVRDVVRDARLNHRVEVLSGVREEECAQVLQDFFGVRRR